MSISGGVVGGLIFGALILLWLRRVTKDDIMVFSIIISSCFLLAYIALFGGIGFSMGVSTITCGLFFSAYGKNYLYRSTAKAIETVFRTICFCFDSLYGFLVGYIIGINILQLHASGQVSEFGKVLTFFLLSFMTRFATILILYPLLSVVGGYNLNYKKVVLLSLSNFRSDLGKFF
jgi:hypothetical protein